MWSKVSSYSAPMNSTAPLAGINVIEITSIYSGPLAGVLLAELGANVVKVESPNKPDLVRNQGAGPHGVSATFYALNRGKRFVSLDANTPEGRNVLVDLVAKADVFLHNIRPGKPEAIGLGYEELAAINPRLIYAAISGLGTEGTEASQPVYDYVVQARIGMVDYQRDISTGKASLISQVVVDKTTAQAAVQGVLAALYVRERTGRGQRIDLPMLGCGLHFEWSDAMGAHFSQVTPAVPLEALPPHILHMPAAALVVVVTSDGGEIACSPALPPFDGFAIAFDRPDWIVDERFAENVPRAFNFPEFRAELTEAALKFTSAELLARLEANGVASGPVQRRADVHNDPQIQRLDLIVESETVPLGRVRQPRPMWHFGETRAEVTSSIGTTGQNTREVLIEAGLTSEAIDHLFASGIAFEG